MVSNVYLSIICIYLCFQIRIGFFAFGMQLIQKLAAYTAGRKLHWIILIGVLHAPISFFDTTPLGRIINRFAKEIDAVDSSLPNSLLLKLLTTLVTVIGTLIILVYGSWLVYNRISYHLAIGFGYIQV